MSKLRLAAALLSLALAGCNQQTAQAETDDSGNAIIGVASVVDGDTIEVHGTRIRLSGYDTPERGARCGDVNVYQRAANELDRFIAGRPVHCAASGTDSHNRAVATCSVNGADLGEHMVSQGWGRDWPRYSRGRYAEDEAEARRSARGVWGLACPASLWGSRDYSR